MEINIHKLKSHSKTEMELINKLVYETNRKFFLEIGAYHFELSEYFLGRLSNVEGKVISVDWKNQLEIKSNLLKHNRCFRFIEGNSMSPGIIKQVENELGENKCDVVFIDGGHQYPIVKSDTENYADLVSDEGYIFWHDACSRVIPFIDELRSLKCPFGLFEDDRGLAYIKGDKWKEWKKSM